MTRPTRVLVSLAVLLTDLAASGSLTGCGRRAGGGAGVDTPADVRVLSSLMMAGPHGCAIVGALRNQSSSPFQYIQIEFNLYDKAGRPVGTALAKTHGLAPGNDWDFSAPVKPKNVASFKIDDTAHY